MAKKEQHNEHELLKFLMLGFGVFSTVFVATGTVLFNLVLSRKGINSEFVAKIVQGNKEKHPLNEYRQSLEKIIDDGAIWFDNVNKEKLKIENRDRNALHAYYINKNPNSNKLIICIHGYNSSPRKMGVYAEKFSQSGYNVLLPSLRGHADSEEDFVTMGWKDRLDVIDWIEYFVSENPKIKIILHGVSMGAATTMMVTGEELPENVVAAVEDCGYTSVWDILGYKIKSATGLPEFPFLYSADSVNKHREKFSFKEASCVEQLKKSVTPTLFIHGEEDDFVPYYMLDEVFDAAVCEKEKLSVPDAPHARSVCAHPDIYWKTILDFINRYAGENNA